VLNLTLKGTEELDGKLIQSGSFSFPCT